MRFFFHIHWLVCAHTCTYSMYCKNGYVCKRALAVLFSAAPLFRSLAALACTLFFCVCVCSPMADDVHRLVDVVVVAAVVHVALVCYYLSDYLILLCACVRVFLLAVPFVDDVGCLPVVALRSRRLATFSTTPAIRCKASRFRHFPPPAAPPVARPPARPPPRAAFAHSLRSFPCV